jgi:hypothetical protein
LAVASRNWINCCLDRRPALEEANMVTRLLGALAGLMLACATVAQADGLPVVGFESGSQAVVSPDGSVRYVTVPAGRDTWLQRRSPDGRVLVANRLRGRFSVPVVAYDGSTAGLSTDGKTLVLIRPRTTFPQASTKLVIVDARTLRIRSLLSLRGDFSFDAISPDGHAIYLVQYTSRVDPTRYRVRALDAVGGRLEPHDVVDPHERSEAMRGYPLARVTSLGGRWAYTLYDGGVHPFVHALDTVGRRARCLDLPPFPSNADPFAARLQLTADRARLLVSIDRHTTALIDTRTLVVSHPARPAGRARRSAEPTDSALPDEAVAIAAFAAVIAAVMLVARRRRAGLAAH